MGLLQFCWILDEFLFEFSFEFGRKCYLVSTWFLSNYLLDSFRWFFVNSGKYLSGGSRPPEVWRRLIGGTQLRVSTRAQTWTGGRQSRASGGELSLSMSNINKPVTNEMRSSDISADSGFGFFCLVKRASLLRKSMDKELFDQSRNADQTHHSQRGNGHHTVTIIVLLGERG